VITERERESEGKKCIKNKDFFLTFVLLVVDFDVDDEIKM
jgi:hypothetical protein